MKQIKLTTFTDPMMGLSYECEPIFRKLETHYAGQIDFHYSMGVLVRDVCDFMIPEDAAETIEQSIRNYNSRLARIYEQEEEICGMPICMDGFQLFDKEHTSSLPLCLADKAVQQMTPQLADRFLYNLRYATIVETRPTTHLDEILRVVRQTGIEEAQFLQCYENGSAELALRHDLQIIQNLGIRNLPAYLLQYGHQRLLFPKLMDYDDFVTAIAQISDGQIYPSQPQPTIDALRTMLSKHPLISPIEISHAFDLQSQEEVKAFIQPLLENNEISIYEVPHGLFIKANC